MRYLGLSLCVLCLTFQPANAQTIESWPVGGRLRVHSTAVPPLRGTLTEIQGDTLFLLTSGGMEGILKRNITGTEVSRGYHRYWLEAGLVGVGAGGLAGFLGYRLMGGQGGERKGQYIGAGAVLFGLVSGIAGYSVRAERWRPASFAFTSPAGPPGATIGLSLQMP